MSGVQSIGQAMRLPFATPSVLVSPTMPQDRATLTILTGPETGAVLALESTEVTIGRGADVTYCLDEPSVSRRHAKISLMEAGARLLEDLGSTNGTYVGGRSIRRTILRSGDRVQLGRVCTLRFAIVDASEESLQRRLYDASTRDELTGAANQRCLFERLGAELAHARREKRPLSVLLLDVDHFKIINDTFGHLAGDHVLRAIANGCAAVMRAGDLFARYGGEEFAVIARDADHAQALRLAERLRSELRALRVEVGSAAISFTVSIGVASLSETDRDGLALFARADTSMYAAKVGGRDRVSSADPPR